MKSKLRGTQLSLDIFVQPVIKTIHDPYWDEIVLEQTQQYVDNQLGANSNPLAPEQSVTVLEQVQRQENVLEQEHVYSAPEQEKICIYSNNLAPEHTYCHWVEIYSPSNRKQHKYYRYCWMSGRKLRHLHIRGGSISNPVAQAMKERVEVAIANGLLPCEIKELITSFKL